MKTFDNHLEFVRNKKYNKYQEKLESDKNAFENKEKYKTKVLESENKDKRKKEYGEIKKRKKDAEGCKRNTEKDLNNENVVMKNSDEAVSELCKIQGSKNEAEDAKNPGINSSKITKNFLSTAEGAQDIESNSKNTNDAGYSTGNVDNAATITENDYNADDVQGALDNNAEELTTYVNEKNIIEKYAYKNSEHDKILKAIYEAMTSNLDNFVYEKCARVAQKITDLIINNDKVNDKTMIRTKILNLRDKQNPILCKNVYECRIKPDEYLNMTNEEMKSNELKLLDKDIISKSLFDAQVPKIEAETDMFKCGKCKETKTTYYQLQTRSADEPMTTFVRCVVCNNRWKF